MPAKGQKTDKVKRILELVKQGLANSEICRLTGYSQACISQTKARNNLIKKGNGLDGRHKYHWKEVQEYYNQGNTLEECSEKFGMCKASFFKAHCRNLFKARSPSEAGILSNQKGRHSTVWSEAAKIKQREIIAKKVEDGTWHYSFSKVRTHEFNSKYIGKVKLMGMWEYRYAEYLDNNNIEWRRPKEKFYYEFEGLKSGKGYYIPDFYLIKEGIYIEVKGYETDKDRAKWKWFPKELKHKVLKYQALLELGLNLSTRN